MQVRYQAALRPEQSANITRPAKLCQEPAEPGFAKAPSGSLEVLEDRAGAARVGTVIRGDEVRRDARVESSGGMEGDDAALGDRHRLAGLEVAARAGDLVANREVAEAGDLHRVAALEVLDDELEERLDEELGVWTVDLGVLGHDRVGDARLVEGADVLLGEAVLLILHFLGTDVG